MPVRTGPDWLWEFPPSGGKTTNCSPSLKLLNSSYLTKQGSSDGFNRQVAFMSMFRNPRDEENLCQVLKAYVEEWGPENVIVSVPEHWSDYSTNSLGRVRLEFVTEDTVSIRVEYDFVRLKYDVQLQAA